MDTNEVSIRNARDEIALLRPLQAGARTLVELCEIADVPMKRAKWCLRRLKKDGLVGFGKNAILNRYVWFLRPTK